MFDLVENQQFRCGMKVHFNSPQVQRSHIIQGWPLKKKKTRFKKKKFCRKDFTSSLLWLATLFRIHAKELGFGNQSFLMQTPRAAGFFPTLWGEPAPLSSHSEHVEGSEISIGVEREAKLVGGGRTLLGEHHKIFEF